jgi:hypothetical protein
VAAVAALVVVFAVGLLAASVVLGRLNFRGALDRAEGSPARIASPRPGEPDDARRRRAELMAVGEALEEERAALEREKRDLAALRDSIKRRRQQFPDGMPPAPAADDQFDVMVYNHRLETLHANIAGFNARTARYRADIEAFMARQRQPIAPSR